MVTIIITALSSSLITLLVYYFIKQFINMQKINKTVIDNTSSIEDLYKNIDELEETFNEQISDIYRHIDNVLKSKL